MSATDSSSVWGFTHRELSHYFAFYHELVPDGEWLAGSRAKEFFILSSLPLPTLSHIWDLSDNDGDGRLNAAEFSLFLNFCQLALDGLAPPPALPSNLALLLEQAINPDKHVPPMKQSQLEKCVSVFLSFVENQGDQGYLAGEAARYLLTNSQLPKAVLFHIWKLSDADKDGRLCFKEFVVAMHLVYIAKLNNPLPIFLDPLKILPQEFNAMEKKIETLIKQKPLSSNRGGGNGRPSVPTFVLPVNNPCILPVFKEIPAERFLVGKFDNFVGNPFRNTTTDDHSPTKPHHQLDSNGKEGSYSYSSSQDDLSNRSSRRSSDTSDSCGVSKLSSSQHSSVKSLVEEKEKPLPQQVESVDTDKTREGEELEDESEELDPIEKEKMEKELEMISKASESYLKKASTPPPSTPPPQSVVGTRPVSNGVENDKFASDRNMQTASVKGLTSAISDMSTSEDKTTPVPPLANEPVPQKEPPPTSDPPPKTQNKSQGIDLSFLDDLEAQVMDVLDDTISFDPSKAPPPEPEKKPPVVKLTPSPPPPSKKKLPSSDDTDSVFVPMSPSKSKTLPHKRTTTTTMDSPFEIRARKTSDSSNDATTPTYRRNTVGTSPIRKKLSSTNRTSLILDDLDGIFSDELAQIDGLMDARKSQNEERKKRLEKETEELKNIDLTQVNIPAPKLTTMEEVARRRDEESAYKQEQWQKEFEEKSKQVYNERMQKKMQLLDDETIHDLESEFQQLIEHEAHQMKDARTIRAKRLEQEEAEKEKIRQQMLSGENKVTVEEWIKMMEENKVKEMSPEERVKYEERKKAWLEVRRKREEEKRLREEEQIRKNREMMEQEYLRQRRIEAEMERSRLTKDQVLSLEQEQLRKEAEERKTRAEQARQRKEEIKQREIENSKPQARSGIAARWEEKVKGRTAKDFSSTVVSQQPKTVMSREEQRLAKRVGKLT